MRATKAVINQTAGTEFLTPDAPLLIQGDRFSSAGNKVVVEQAGQRLSLVPQQESATQLRVTLPSTLALGRAIIYVANNLGQESKAQEFTLHSATGYEGDISPRPLGDGAVTMADWVLAGMFIMGAEKIDGEFQRLDCAPLATRGDGQITLADWVQVGRFMMGLEPLVPAGGPTNP